MLKGCAAGKSVGAGVGAAGIKPGVGVRSILTSNVPQAESVIETVKKRKKIFLNMGSSRKSGRQDLVKIYCSATHLKVDS
jgi:hypothetical protein